jgi:endonuclease G
MLLSLCYSTATQAQRLSTSVHLEMGNPSGATSNAGNSDNYLIVKPQYALSYNDSKRIPNWTSWQLNQSWLGNVRRSNDFRPDNTLPDSFYQVTPNDYRDSGFTRGHMTPSGDRTAKRDDNSATFLMTNMIPQSSDNNQGPWEKLESYSRELVRQGKELYIISGGYGGNRTISANKIEVPSNTWKIVVVLDKPGEGIEGVSSNTRVIAVDMPNTQGIRNLGWAEFTTSVDSIEAKTGYDFLSNVPTSVQDAIESKVDNRS